MICCKIVANYQQVCTHFNELFEELNKVLQPKQMRTIERLRRELSDYVW